MKAVRILVLGDGKHEVGVKSDTPPEQGQEPALLCLVRRLLNSPKSLSLDGRFFRGVRAAHGRGRNKYMKKTVSAIRKAKKEGYAGLAIVIDRDRYPDRDRLGAIREGREALEGEAPAPCALGCAAEAFDAWMLADRGAVAGAGGNVDALPPHPEDLPRPKDAADGVFGTTASTGLGAHYARVAAVVGLELLKKSCPVGFSPFAKEVQQRLGPVVANAQ